jgi:hypothetical protein
MWLQHFLGMYVQQTNFTPCWIGKMRHGPRYLEPCDFEKMPFHLHPVKNIPKRVLSPPQLEKPLRPSKSGHFKPAHWWDCWGTWIDRITSSRGVAAGNLLRGGENPMAVAAKESASPSQGPPLSSFKPPCSLDPTYLPT